MREVRYIDVGPDRRVAVEPTDNPDVVILHHSEFGITPGMVTVEYLKCAAREYIGFNRWV